MSLCEANFCDIVVFVFNSMIIMQIEFIKSSVLNPFIRSTVFFKKVLLPKLEVNFEMKKGIMKV